MKEANLISLVHAYKGLDPALYQSYFQVFKINIREHELDDLESFIEQIKFTCTEMKIFDKYFLGYTIPQISKEFDLLRFGINYVVNIELKSSRTEEKIIKQLTKNQYYLSFLDKEIYSYTYVSSEKKLYSLDGNQNLIEKPFYELAQILLSQEISDTPNVNYLFNPSNYLVSPFNSTQKFIEGKYFLTNQQEEIKKDTMDILSKKGTSFLSICGKAGTGKTLLIYDIVKDFIKSGSKVLLVHCGYLNDGHRELIETLQWNIVAIKDLDYPGLANYSLIVIDETQRIRIGQLQSLIHSIKANTGNCVFSYDEQQCLRKKEITNKISEYISTKTSSKVFKLSEKIRTNKEIASFITALQDKSRDIRKIDRTNIELSYFNHYVDAVEFINHLKIQGWEVVNYTPDSQNIHPYTYFAVSSAYSVHGVIGQEFDNVVAVIDQHFYYEGNKLDTKGYKNRPYYHPTKMLYQIMTRTRKKLSVIVINNKEIMERCLSILETI